MQAKTIKSVLGRKIDQWLATIDDEAVRALAAKNVIVTGGSIVSMLLQEPVNDYDVYFRTGEAAFAVAQYYVEKFKASGKASVELLLTDVNNVPITSFGGGQFKVMAKSAGVVSDDTSGAADYQYFEQTDPDGDKADEYLNQVVDAVKGKSTADATYRPVFMSSNAISLSDKIQLIIRFFGEPDEIHKNYDFVHCTSYWTSWDGKLVLRAEALEAILSKTLVYVGSLYPICSVIRTRKFIGRGWRITAGQYLKMCMQISDLNLRDIKVLSAQMIGVDSAYFQQLISDLEKQRKITGSDVVDHGYLVQLIDRIF